MTGESCERRLHQDAPAGQDNTIAGLTRHVVNGTEAVTNLETKIMKSSFVYGPTFAEMRDPSRIKLFNIT
jgi:hypothetical protein